MNSDPLRKIIEVAHSLGFTPIRPHTLEFQDTFGRTEAGALLHGQAHLFTVHDTEVWFMRGSKTYEQGYKIGVFASHEDAKIALAALFLVA